MFSNVEEQATVSVKYYLKTKSDAPFSEEESVWRQPNFNASYAIYCSKCVINDVLKVYISNSVYCILQYRNTVICEFISSFNPKSYISYTASVAICIFFMQNDTAIKMFRENYDSLFLVKVQMPVHRCMTGLTAFKPKCCLRCSFMFWLMPVLQWHTNNF